MNNKIKHTFCVIAYKTSPFLNDCLLSLKNQDLKSKIIICTSTPNESIYKTAKKFDIAVKINKNCGKVNDWNFALNQAKTQYVTLAHHDDVYFPNYTSSLLSLMKKEKNSLIGFTNYIETLNFKNGDEKERRKSIFLNIKIIIISFFFFGKKYISNKFTKKYFLSFGDPICCPSVMFNLKNLKNFSFKNFFKVNIDWQAWYELSNKTGSFVYSKKILVKHRIHQFSDTTTALTDNTRINEDLEMFNFFWPPFIAKTINYFYKLSYKNNEI